VVTPAGLAAAAPAFAHPAWLLWGVGVGVCSSVIPYVTDQLAMARLPRATFALMLALLPATATVIGLIVLRQIPTPQDLLGIGLVVAGVAVHRDPQASDPHADDPHADDPYASGQRASGQRAKPVRPARGAARSGGSDPAQERVGDRRRGVRSDPATLDEHREGEVAAVADEPCV
jgi:inner membrane transporter RhtA